MNSFTVKFADDIAFAGLIGNIDERGYQGPVHTVTEWCDIQ